MSTTTARPERAHPTRPAPPSHLQWLRDEVADWIGEGLVSPIQADALLDRYHPARRISLARLLLGLGAAFVGLGLIWLVAANLDQLAPAARFVAVAVLWLGATVGAELLAARRSHGGPIPSPVVHGARLLAALLLGAVIFQAAQSLQVPAYEPKLVGLWSLGALAHGYLLRAVAPVAVGVLTAFAWVLFDAAWSDLTTLGWLLAVAALGVVGVSVAVIHDASAPRPDVAAADGRRTRGWSTLADPWRELGAFALLAVLFTAALPFVDQGDDFRWTTTLVVDLLVALVALTAATALAVRHSTSRLLWTEPLGALLVAVLSAGLVLWDAGADADDVGAAGWAHAILAVAAYLLVATGVAVVGILHDRGSLTVLALAALVLFTTVQAFAVFAQIVQGAWLFLAVGLVLAGTGWLADRGRRQLARTLDEGGAR